MIARDKILHLALGCLAAAVAYLALIVHSTFGLGPMLAFITTVVGIGYEAQQRFRREGQVEALDAIATAAPGWLAWGILWIYPKLSA
jgi:hypothetical protein